MNNKALDLNNLDTSVKPGADFYRYAIGNWQKNNPIPAEYSSWGSFVILGEENLITLREIMETGKGQVGDFYASGMDEKKIEKAGIKPLADELARIEAINDLKGLTLAVAHLHQYSADPLFHIFVGPDYANSDLNIAELYQGGLNLPDRDYYLKDDKYSKEIRAKYQQYVTKMFMLMGAVKAEAEAKAKVVLKIETGLAKISRDKVALRDPRKNYNPLSLKTLAKLANKFDWPLYFQTIGLKKPGKINVGQPEFFAGLNQLMATVTIADWRTYLTFTLVNDNAEFLSSAFVNEEFNFYGRTLNGNKVLMPRWKRVVGTVNAYLDQAVGRLFVKERFSPQAKSRAGEMVRNIRAAFKKRLAALDWMTDKTKKEAFKKLAAMTFKIGYPGKWREYKFKVERGEYLANVFRGNYFDFHYELNKVGKKVDRNEWGMPVQIVNAGYMPTRNEMLFPAGILQPPFFNAAADDPVNYGAIGMVIAHEMTHGFDDQGRKFDKRGNLKDWWTKQDEVNFKAKAKAVVEQAEAFEQFPGMPLNGELTLGENIADLGGVSISHDALQFALGKKKQPLLDGLTPERRFFLSYAEVWKTNMRDERAKLLVKVDPHAPAKYRVNGPLSNLPEFYAAFNIASNEAMFRPEAKRAKVW
ncbi:MAG: M13 family metallopeptidase [Candidatus Margulisiibacteriota bacterium]|jgi:putative endopeptidase